MTHWTAIRISVQPGNMYRECSLSTRCSVNTTGDKCTHARGVIQDHMRRLEALRDVWVRGREGTYSQPRSSWKKQVVSLLFWSFFIFVLLKSSEKLHWKGHSEEISKGSWNPKEAFLSSSVPMYRCKLPISWQSQVCIDALPVFLPHISPSYFDIKWPSFWVPLLFLCFSYVFFSFLMLFLTLCLPFLALILCLLSSLSALYNLNVWACQGRPAENQLVVGFLCFAVETLLQHAHFHSHRVSASINI